MRMIWTLGVLGMLTGCDGCEQKGAEGGDTDTGPTDDTSDTGCAETATLYPDQDGDGYGSSAEAGEGGCLDRGLELGWSTNALDCDDEDPGVYPGATETCNELDDDCDGSEDEDVLNTWYLDYDRDGYGNNNDDFIEACDSSGSYDATEAGDCDDVNASVTGPTAWHPDADGDGFGAPDWEERTCEAPEGGVTDATDCDDADEGVYPGAVEVCDGVDQDCDGVVDWGAHALALDGEGDHMLISRTDEMLDLGLESITIEAWVLTSDDSGAARIWSKGSFGWSQGYMMRTHDGVLLAEMSGPYGYGVACPGTTLVADGTWHHVAASFDRAKSTITIIVDGVDDGSCSLSAIEGQSAANERDPTIGINDGDLTEEPFSGLIGEVRLWSEALDATTVKERMCAPLSVAVDSLAGYWPMQDDTMDATGLGHDGTLAGDAAIVSR